LIGSSVVASVPDVVDATPQETINNDASSTIDMLNNFLDILFI
jgi:hypothetical protein